MSNFIRGAYTQRKERERKKDGSVSELTRCVFSQSNFSNPSEVKPVIRIRQAYLSPILNTSYHGASTQDGLSLWIVSVHDKLKILVNSCI